MIRPKDQAGAAVATTVVLAVRDRVGLVGTGPGTGVRHTVRVGSSTTERSVIMSSRSKSMRGSAAVVVVVGVAVVVVVVVVVVVLVVVAVAALAVFREARRPKGPR
jgi:hypothetical protein